MAHLSLDDAAWTNRWSHRHVGDKAVLSLGLLAVASLSGPVVALGAGALATAAGVLGARVPWRTWLRILLAPGLFVAVGLVGVVVTLDPGTAAPLWQWGPLAVTEATATRGTEVAARSAGSVCALMLLASTTPVTAVLGSLARLRLPTALLEVAGLVYRLLFDLLDVQARVREAQAQRLGYTTPASARRSVGLLGAAVLRRTWTHAERLEEGLQGRGYDGRLTVLPRTTSPDPTFVVTSLLVVLALPVTAAVLR